MPRLRLYDLRLSRMPALVGRVPADVAGIAQIANSAQRRLLMCKETGDEGWYGTFAEMSFNNVSRAAPYITTPREVARIIAVNLCRHPLPVNNQFYEYLDFGSGRMPKTNCSSDSWNIPAVFTRNNAITFGTMATKPSFLRVYATNPSDVTLQKRVFFQGTDQNDATIWTVDNGNNVMGEFVTLNSPFGSTLFSFNNITGIQKDITFGVIQIFSVDPTTAVETLIHEMQPGETVAGYRRYYLNHLPVNCCHQGISSSDCASPDVTTVAVKAIVKLEPVPVMVDTDYFILQNLEALTEECAAVRYSEMDDPQAKAMAGERHQQAVRMLNGELAHYYGLDQPAVQFAPFGSARLERLNLTMQ